MSELGEIYEAMRKRTKQHHREMLARADVEGWTKHTDYHYSRNFGGKRMEWWPSAGKARYNGDMIYGHRKVNALIAKLKKNHPTN